MKKKYIIAVAVAILALAVLFAACKKDEEEEDKPVNGESNAAESISTEENGDMYVTNVDGDKIPVTTDKDGFFDDIKSLVTATTAKASEQSGTSSPASANKGEPSSSQSDAPTSKPQENTSGTGAPEKTTANANSTTAPTEAQTFKIGTDGNQNGGVVSWQEIVDNANKAKKQ